MEPVLDIRILVDLLTRLAATLRAATETQLLISLEDVLDFWDQLDSDEDPNALYLSLELQRTYAKFTAELVQSLARDLLQPSPAFGAAMILIRAATESLARLRHISTPSDSPVERAKKTARMVMDDAAETVETINPEEEAIERSFARMEAWLEDRGFDDRARYGRRYGAKIENLLPGFGRNLYKKAAGFSHGNSISVCEYMGVGLQGPPSPEADEAGPVDNFERRELDTWIAGMFLGDCLIDALSHIIDSAHFNKGFDDSWRAENSDLIPRLLRDVKWHCEILEAYTQTSELVSSFLKAYLISRSADESGGHAGEADEKSQGA